ncbi:MAG TPA: response regulator [Roseiflexaceae bacterium]|nr:response regulator [Roseiflexaceae bacterium]
MSQALGQPVSTAPGAEAAARILVVDDEQHMCDICSRTLRLGGYEVVATSDPQAAARLLQRDRPFDLLLTDIKMPTMSGLELARIAHERDPAIAVIIMTGFASLENLQQSVQRGVADFLAKPFELEQLRLAVDQALHKRALLQDNLRLRALEQLLSSSEALSTTLALPELVGIVLRVTIRQSGCAAGFLLLADEPGRLGEAVASAPEGELLPEGRALAERALVERQAILSGAPACRLGGAPLQHALAVPLRAQGQLTGVLVLCDDTPNLLRPGVQEGIMLLANHAGAALHNAYLYSQLDDAFQRRQELDRMKSEFISIASHELRTPLALVLGYTMMVRDQSSGEQREYLQRVLEGAQRIKEIVDDMVSLRHVETGEAQMELQPVVIQDLIRQALDRVRQGPGVIPHTIAYDMPDEPLVLQGDREKLAVIFGHLLSNAVKFTPEQGLITVRASVEARAVLDATGTYIVRPAPHESGPWLVVAVQDTGIGIPEHEQVRIFDRFYQVADSLTRDRGGTGLGLALVRELVAVLGGALLLTSRAGEGSTFSVALPYRPPPEAGA